MKPTNALTHPADWLTRTVGQAIEIKRGVSWSKEQEHAFPRDGAVPVIRIGNVQEQLQLDDLLYISGLKTKAIEKKRVSAKWSILVGSNGNRARVGNAVFIDQDMQYLFASFLIAAKPKEGSGIRPDYFYRWLSMGQIQAYLSASSEGTTGLNNLSHNFFKSMVIPFPRDINEQDSITYVLNVIDETIKQQEALLEKVLNLKKALSQHLLSAKYNTAVKSWVKVSLPDIATINPEYKLIRGKIYPFIEMSNVKENFRGVQKVETRKFDGSGLSRFTQGDTLFAKITPCPENGKIAFVNTLPDKYALGSTEFIVFAPKENCYPKYLFHLLCFDEIRGRAICVMEGSTGRQRVPIIAFKKIIAAVIPKEIKEQKEISNVLDGVDDLIRVREEKINHLAALKKSLTNDLLIGKVIINKNMQGAFERYE